MTARGRAAVAVLLATAAALVLAAGVAAGHPPLGTDHGVPQSTFDTLWSADEGGTIDPDVNVTRFIGETSDHSFLEPPRSPEVWNAGEHDELDDVFDSGATVDGDTHTVHPAGVELEDAVGIKDAYAAVFAVQPSAVWHVEGNRTRRVIATDGTVLGVVDFRVDRPGCSLDDYGVESTSLRTDTGAVFHGSGTQTPAISYSGLSSAVEKLQFRAKIFVEYSGCADDEMIVSTEIDVTPSDLDTFGAFAEYPDGDVGVFVLKQRPYPGAWRGLRLPNQATIHSPYRFFSARRTEWDNPLTELDQGGSDPVHIAEHHVHPLQVHAYPSRRGVRAESSGGRRPVVRETVGPERRPATLPEHVRVDVVRENYTQPWGYDVRYAGGGGGPLEAHHLHAGDGVAVNVSGPAIAIRRSDLTLRALEANASHVRLRVSLSDAATGAPIETDGPGHVRIQGATRVNTSAGGTANVTVERPTGAVSARYEPAPWWRASDPYDGDRTSLLVTERDEAPSLPDTVVRFFVLVSPFLALVYMIDRAFGLDVWPPWRDL